MTPSLRVSRYASTRSDCLARAIGHGSSSGLQWGRQISADPAPAAQESPAEHAVLARLASALQAALQAAVRACAGVLVLATSTLAASAAPAQVPKLQEETFQERCLDCAAASRPAAAGTRALPACDTTATLTTPCSSRPTTPVATREADAEIDQVLLKFLERRRAARAEP